MSSSVCTTTNVILFGKTMHETSVMDDILLLPLFDFDWIVKPQNYRIVLHWKIYHPSFSHIHNTHTNILRETWKHKYTAFNHCLPQYISNWYSDFVVFDIRYIIQNENKRHRLLWWHRIDLVQFFEWSQ